MKRSCYNFSGAFRTKTVGRNFSSSRHDFRISSWLATGGVGAAATLGFASMTDDSFDFYGNQPMMSLSVARTLAVAITNISTSMTTQMDYLEHDPKDYDIYIQNPTAEDLPYLLNQFDEHGKEVWPWIWTHPNETGPHYVFIGVTRETLHQIRELRSMSSTYNILLIASEESLREAAKEVGDANIYDETLCGVVTDATLKLLNVEAKIIMLSDERVIAFNSLTIS
eukprot:CAMPEP_0172367720 /NCGR_PEP_ID=MMETSP1060-20121228/23271_1 /TAXON_ID=37318 /ORGANISM="Pseudo-nitzschia pungens, Strain cf. cingulata" /LENGTH=224 /DNA_ID=CAMNT_0013092067 /DNA_START=63 /DNA_END=737 /DNA_ORIENTATION=-